MYYEQAVYAYLKNIHDLMVYLNQIDYFIQSCDFKASSCESIKVYKMNIHSFNINVPCR